MQEYAEQLRPDLSDRRNSQRFPLQLSVKYRVIGDGPEGNWCVTETLNISSKGILFKTEDSVQLGRGVEAFVSWPVALDKRVALKLALRGPVVRSEGNRTAVRFERYEFKTRSVDGSAAA
ncbi:MAG: PilZ domain-containing protein [Acidobacteriota bacterium]|nr:PilZ domain-containing protein [Acidobacteriota bacterium]